MERKVRYYKPNIGNLHGKIGRSILDTIRNTPKPDQTVLWQEAKEFEKTYDKEKMVNAEKR